MHYFHSFNNVRESDVSVLKKRCCYVVSEWCIKTDATMLYSNKSNVLTHEHFDQLRILKTGDESVMRKQSE